MTDEKRDGGNQNQEKDLAEGEIRGNKKKRKRKFTLKAFRWLQMVMVMVMAMGVLGFVYAFDCCKGTNE